MNSLISGSGGNGGSGDGNLQPFFIFTTGDDVQLSVREINLKELLHETF